MNRFVINKNIINNDNPVPHLELSLHKPNEEQVGSLSDVYNRNSDFYYGRYNEMTFTIPKFVDRKHEKVRYVEYDRIREKYLVKASYGGLFSEYLVVTKIKKSKDSNGMPTKTITLQSRQYELNNKVLREIEAPSYTPKESLELALTGTQWKIGEIDDELELIINPDGTINDPDKVIPRRSFNETKITSLNLLYKIAETFGVVLMFNTFARTVSIWKPENAEIDMGFFASYGKYIKSMSEDLDSVEMVTRLYIYGKDGMSINEVNPTGQSYLEDFSYFMDGYETDENGNVISSSPYISDETCQAVIDYNLLLIEKDGVFKTYIEELDATQEIYVAKMTEMYELESDMAIILDKLDVAKAHVQEDIPLYKSQRDDKQAEIDAKQIEIDDVNNQITLIENDIQDLRNLLSQENNFTPEQVDEMKDYIVDGEWSDSNYFDVEELYEKGKEIMKKKIEPKKDLDMSVVQFLEAIECKNDWDKIGLGYVIRVDYEPLDTEFKALIAEMKIGFDSKSMSISISNVDYKSDKQNFLNMLYSSAISTADRLESKDKEWSDAVDKADYLEEFLDNPWETSRQRILAGVDECIQFSRRGVIITNPRFPNEKIIMQSGILALSLDNGETWSTGVTAQGIFAERLIGRAITGEKLSIGDEEGTFDIRGNVLTIKDRNDVVRLRLGEYKNNNFGLQLMNKTGKQVVLDENGILQTTQPSRSDNVDTTHGLTLYVYLPPETLSIRHAKLNFRLLPFRSYAGTTESGGGEYLSSASGGAVSTSTASGGSSNQTSSSGGSVSKSTNSGGESTKTSSAGGDHKHLMFSIVGWDSDPSPNTNAVSGVVGTNGGALKLPGDNASGSYYTQGSSGSHSHSVSIPSHSHSFTVPNHSHTVNIPAHRHDVTIPNHTHTINIPAHKHDIAHGIYTSTFATGVGVIINGINRTSQLGGKFNSSQANIDIKDYLEAGAWNEVELTSDRLGRLDANIFLQMFCSTD